MLKGLAAATALKYAAACVCPVAGTAAVTLGSPKLRAAVHRMTEPQRAARAKPAVRRAPATETPLALAAGFDCLAPAVDFVAQPKGPVVASAPAPAPVSGGASR